MEFLIYKEKQFKILFLILHHNIKYNITLRYKNSEIEKTIYFISFFYINSITIINIIHANKFKNYKKSKKEINKIMKIKKLRENK